MQERDYWKQMLSSVRRVLDEVNDRTVVITSALELKKHEGQKIRDQGNEFWQKSFQKRQEEKALRGQPGANLNEARELGLDADFLESSARLNCSGDNLT